MKKIIMMMILLVCLAGMSFGQITSDIVSVDSTLTKANLYSNALTFFATEFKSANAVIQMKDSEAGKVIGKGIVDGREIIISITCKDGKYKYEIEISGCPIDENIKFKVKNFGMNAAKSIGKVVCINGKPTIPLDLISVNGPGGVGGCTYTNGSGKNYEKWKIAIDNEMVELNKKYADLSNPNGVVNKPIIDGIISDLKKEMSKKSDF